MFQSFATEREKVFEIRKAIMRGNPVLVEFWADPSFVNTDAVPLWEPTRSDNKVLYALLITAYDETRQAFEVMGSWGSTWANNGYLWVSYQDMANAAAHGYVMIPNTY
ncbi:MAG: C1 family peptidase [Saprospiraceae bacterium]